VACPYCEQINVLTEKPNAGFTCIHCARVIPVEPDGTILPVFQVRCGYCNSLNYYNEKSEALICEVCDREIPISTNAETPRNLPRSFTIHDDDNLYELVLVDAGNKTEEVIKVLQQMLALNRSQVKQVIADAPVTLLTGITRKKAEMLQIQLGVHDASAEFRAIESTQQTV
jgi:ribosomal protein L7/L12